MYPVLCSPTYDVRYWTTFANGVLSDAISCEVEENRNGEYELEMQYPITGRHYSKIALRWLIIAKPNYTDEPQPFRIYSISKEIDGVVTINAQHVSYDLSGYVASPFTATGIQDALSKLSSSSVVYPSTITRFTFTSDMSGTQTMSVKHPESVRALMGGVEGSLIDLYGGEWHFNGRTCELLSARGENRGVAIRYGKNMTDLTQEENIDAVYTAVFPYYYSEDTETLVTLTNKVVNVSGTFNHTRILPLDLTAEFSEAPTEAQLQTAAENYITNNQIGTPKVNLTVSFATLSELSERVDLCDTVSVYFDALGVSATAKCIRTKWDVLKDRYIEAELGSARNSLASTIANTFEVKKAIKDGTSQLATVASAIAGKVTGNAGGYIVLHDTNGDGEPDELLILNRATIASATRVIRINNAGIAFSKNGYAGPYSTAWNIDGEFVADFIASGSLQTNSVTIFGDANFTWDNANIQMINPSNTDQIIRFGKYDGTHYGLGFSVDGGTTWTSGFSFDGIRLLGNVGTQARVVIDSDSFDIVDENNVGMCHLGAGTVLDTDGASVDGYFYRLGTRMAGSAGNGAYAVSLGRLNDFSGAYAIVLGYNCKGTGNYSTAIGYLSEATGPNSVAIGTRNSVTAERATCIGSRNANAIPYSVCFGHDNSLSCTSGNSATCIGNGNTIESANSTAFGDANVLQGNGLAYGNLNTITTFAYAFGDENEVSGRYSFVYGMDSVVSGMYVYTLGRQLKVQNNYICVIGKFNTGSQTSTGYALIVGGGTSDTNRADPLILTNGGNMTITGSLTQNSDSRLKTIIGEAPDLSGIRAVRYKWNEKKFEHDNDEHIGYIAQEVEKAAPYLVHEDGSGYKTIDYIGLLCAKVEQLEKTVAGLTKRIAELEGGVPVG